MLMLNLIFNTILVPSISAFVWNHSPTIQFLLDLHFI